MVLINGIKSIDNKNKRTLVKISQKPSSLYRLIVCLGLSFVLTSTWIMTHDISNILDISTLGARNIVVSLGDIIIFAFIYLLIRATKIFLKRKFLVLMISSLIVGSVCVLFGILFQSIWPMMLGTSISALGLGGLYVYAGFSFILLDKKQIPMVLAGAFILKYIFVFILEILSSITNQVMFILFSMGSIFLFLITKNKILENININTEKMDMSITKYTPLFSFRGQLFAIIIIFSAALGLSLTYGEAKSQPHIYIYLAGIGLIVIIYMVFIRKIVSFDIYYIIAFVLLLIGLLLIYGNFRQSNFAQMVSRAFLQSSSDAFCYVLLFLMCTTVANNNVSVVPMFFIYYLTYSIGIEIGALLGQIINSLSETTFGVVLFIVALLTLSLVLFNIILLRKFSFDIAVNVMHPIKTLRKDNEMDTNLCALEQACWRIIKNYSLTKREAEIFDLLARGRNVAYIQESLILSRSTVKTHIANIYSKLNIHSHQELIDLVEQNN